MSSFLEMCNDPLFPAVLVSLSLILELIGLVIRFNIFLFGVD